MEFGCCPTVSFLSHNGGHLSIEFVDSFQNDTRERSCQQFPSTLLLKRKRLARKEGTGRADQSEAKQKLGFAKTGARAKVEIEIELVCETRRHRCVPSRVHANLVRDIPTDHKPLYLNKGLRKGREPFKKITGGDVLSNKALAAKAISRRTETILRRSLAL